VRIAPPPWPPQTGATRAVALEVLINGPLSRSELARRLDLSQGSLTRLSTPLIESGLLFEGDKQPTGRSGPRTRPLDIVAGSRHFVGIKLTGDHVQGIVTDLRADVCASAEAPLDSRTPEVVADAVAKLALDLCEEVPAVTALGVGVGALVRDYTTVASAPFLDWSDVPLGPMLEQRTGLPTVIENDVVAYTESEHWFGAGRGLDRFAVLTIGAGVGYGAVIHDRVLVGDDSGVGLVGHWPLDPLGPICPAGHRGCADSLLAMPAITKSVSAALDRQLAYDECLDLAAGGDPAARRIVDDAGVGLGRLVAAVANLTVPQKIILSGEGVRLARVAADAIQDGLHRDRDPRAGEVSIEINDTGTLQWCRGAAVIAIQTFVLGAHPSPDGAH
jgi:predicted NBD/HSP70 family sugar kinase